MTQQRYEYMSTTSEADLSKLLDQGYEIIGTLVVEWEKTENGSMRAVTFRYYVRKDMWKISTK